MQSYKLSLTPLLNMSTTSGKRDIQSAASPTQPTKSPRVDASRKSLRNTPDFDSVVSQLRQFGQEHVYQDLQNFDEEHPVYKQLQGLNIERSVGHFHSANA